jgi:succinoglycan biosynthesis transport protein ExoP
LNQNLNSNDELTLRDVAVIFRRRRKVVYGTIALFGILAAIYCLVSTRRYEATATLQVQNKSQDRLGLENMSGGAADNGTDALTSNINLQTQANILGSDTLALKTIEDLHMEDTQDFKRHWSPIGWITGLFSPRAVEDPPNASLEDSPQRRHYVLTVFSKNLSVKPVSGTRLITISYLNPDPKLAAAVVNRLMQSLIDYANQSQYQATNQAAGWLSSQLGDLRQQSEDLQRKVADMQSKSSVYNLGTVDPQGHDQAYSGVLDQLQQATAALNQSEQNRILRGAILQAAESGNAEMLSGLAGNAANSSGVNNSLGLIQNLRAQEATQEAALKEAETKYGTAYPKVQELHNNIVALQNSIQQEVERLKDRARSDYDSATHDTQETRARYDQAKAAADGLNNQSVNFTILKQESDESRKLYQQLLERFKAAGVLESLKGSDITVVDPGRVPSKPAKPDAIKDMAIALVAGFLLGSCLALVLDLTDNKIKSIDEVERISGVNLLGVTPAFNAKQASLPLPGQPTLASLDDPQSQFIEAARAIRTEILLKSDGDESKVILVTSSIPGEGKTVLSANLAVLLSQSNKRVLLVDTDLRIGSLRSLLNIPSGIGLSEILDGQPTLPDIHTIPAVPNLDILQAGESPSNPSELLGSSYFRDWLSLWREKYDYVVLDSAPLLPVTDSLTLAPLSDIVLLIARPGVTEKSQLARSYQLLTRNGNRFVATVLNGLRPEEVGYSSYFGYGKGGLKYSELVKSK